MIKEIEKQSVTATYDDMGDAEITHRAFDLFVATTGGHVYVGALIHSDTIGGGYLTLTSPTSSSGTADVLISTNQIVSIQPIWLD
jgi:hypothetical protein